MRLRLEILDVVPPVVRVVDVPSTLRVVELHELIQSLFGWTGRFDHQFADRPYAAPGRRRVWEMEHWCRDRAPDHTSACAWTSSVGDAFSMLEPAEWRDREGVDALYYEYGRLEECPDERRDRYGDAWDTGPTWRGGADLDEWDSGPAWRGDTNPASSGDLGDERCMARALGVTDEHEHGWLMAITPEGRTPLREDHAVGAHIVSGRGRSPIEACQGASGHAALLAVLADAEHPLHGRVDAWTRDVVGPWSTRGTQPLDPDAFDAASEQLALEWRPTYAWYGPPSPLDRALRVTDDRGSSRAELLTALLHARGDDADLPSAVDAAHLTAALRESLASLPSSRAKPPATVGVDVPPEHEAWLRSGRVAYRRNRVLVRSRAGDAALDDPFDLLRRIALTYWSIGTSSQCALFVAMAAAEGLIGDELRAWVSAAVRNPDLELDDLAPWCSFLDRCGGLAAVPLDSTRRRALARLVLHT